MVYLWCVSVCVYTLGPGYLHTEKKTRKDIAKNAPQSNLNAVRASNPTVERKADMAKNECAKTRPVTQPYEVWENARAGWKWKVLKKYQADDAKPYARWFCHASSPYCPEGELGDVYAAEVKANAVRIK